MGSIFIAVERRSTEPIMPLYIFKNRIVAVSLLVILITGFGMFGSIIFVPLFFQGVLGASATASGSFLTPMMLGVVAGSILSGQILSRLGGHYRIQGAFGLAMMGAGMGLLATMSTETLYGMAMAYIVLLGFGLGSTMPLYVIAIQNAVPYSIMGIATSTTAFFRQIGGVFGLAVLGSVMNNHFSSAIISGLSPEKKVILPDELINSLATNPQALVSPDAQEQLIATLEMLFGAQAEAIFQEILGLLRTALSSAITQAFLIGFAVIVVAWFINFFVKEIPLRRQNV
jgi:MFS family permease